MFCRSLVSLLALSAVLAAPARGEDVASTGAEASSSGGENDGGVILVTGTRDSYIETDTNSATRTDTPLVGVPQAVTVITERRIDDQAMRSIGDVLRTVPGAMIGQGEGHRDQITLRGNNSTADFFVDGLRDDIQYYRPLYNLQRIEVLRGPNAMIFGRGGGGGVVNRVTKTPVLEPAYRFSGSLDTFGAWHADADLSHPFSESFAGRLNAVYEEFANHRDFYEGRLIAANPTLRLLAGRETGIGLSYEYVDDERVVDRGIPAARPGTLADPARPLAGFRDTFFGQPGTNRLNFTGHILRGTVEHRFSDAVTLVSRLLLADYDKAYRNAFAATPVTTNAQGGRQVAIEAYFDAFQRQNLFSQTDLVWRVATGRIDHVLLAGAELGRQETGNQRLNGFFDTLAGTDVRRATVALADPVVIPAITFRAGPGRRATESDADILAFYVQDQMEVGPVELVAGLRYDRFDIAVIDFVTGARTARTDHLWSPRLGFIVRPADAVSLYASYSRSYLPQSGDQFNSLDVTGANLEPERFDNYEIGIKWQPRDDLLFSAAAYQLDRTNTRATLATGQIVQTGEQRSRGIEIEAAGRIRPDWQIALGYALQDAEIVERTAACDPAARRCDVAQVPRHQLSAWTRYDFTPRLGAGIGLRHQSRSFASISNTVVLPAYMRLDAALFFRLTHQIEAQINVENLLDETYFPTAHSDTNITTGAPITARGTLRFRF